MRHDFPATARLHRPSEYATVLKGQRIARGAMFVVMRARGIAVGNARLGLVIPKRLAALAVTRNTIKRVLRETFRHYRAILPPGDMVFRLVAPPGKQSLTQLKKQVRAEAETLFAKITTI
ncbi:ribonuclease P protein component [Alcaligenaceae bacterium CGII-47]|nr:ribonuclease P protein component [Alcaligenaceae bacterium CGII-47]